MKIKNFKSLQQLAFFEASIIKRCLYSIYNELHKNNIYIKANLLMYKKNNKQLEFIKLNKI